MGSELVSGFLELVSSGKHETHEWQFRKAGGIAFSDAEYSECKAELGRELTRYGYKFTTFHDESLISVKAWRD